MKLIRNTLGRLSAIGKKLKRRTRAKGSLSETINRPGRNQPRGTTAVDLWQRAYRFKETPPARAGTKRRIARERKLKNVGFSVDAWCICTYSKFNANERMTQ